MTNLHELKKFKKTEKYEENAQIYRKNDKKTSQIWTLAVLFPLRCSVRETNRQEQKK